MENQEKKPRLHIHLGGVVILIILALILFKVDLKDKIESEQFQKNLSYITEKASDMWKKYIVLPFNSKASGWFMDIANSGVEKIQESIADKTKSLIDDEISNAQNSILDKE